MPTLTWGDIDAAYVKAGITMCSNSYVPPVNLEMSEVCDDLPRLTDSYNVCLPTSSRVEQPPHDEAIVGFKTGYLDIALDDLDTVISSAIDALEDVDFDTLVGTGFSGALVVPMLASAMDKNFILVRKPNDGSHHSGRLIGNLGRRWIFVDDFVSSGATRKRVRDEIADNAEGKFHTLYVGDYTYHEKKSGSGFRKADEWDFEED